MADMNSIEKPDRWWTWRWDTLESCNVYVPYTSIKRWRRGSLFTIYRMEFSEGGVQWWFYGPFNLCFGFGRG